MINYAHFSIFYQTIIMSITSFNTNAVKVLDHHILNQFYLGGYNNG
jgi:hypothetical protein